MLTKTSTASLLLRIALAFAFLYPAIAAWFNPAAWLGYFPPFLLGSGVPELWLLHGFGVIEIALALWLLFPQIPRNKLGLGIHYPAAAAGVILLAITAFNWQQLDVLFRDLSLALAAFALAAKR